MMTFFPKAKRFLDRNIATLTAGLVIVFVLFFVPQISTILWQVSIHQIWAGGAWLDRLLGSLFLLFIVFLVVSYAAAWYAVIPLKYLRINGLPTCNEPPTKGLRRTGFFRPQHWLAWLFWPVYIVAAFPNWLAGKMSKKSRWWIAVVLLVAAVANFVTREVFDFPAPDADLLGYPLAGSTWSLMGWLLVPWVLWWAYSAAWGPEPGNLFGRTWTMLGRIFVLLTVTTCLGEVLWMGADLVPMVLSYRVYTIWVIFHLAFGVAVVGVALDVCHWRFPWPVRPIALLTGVLLLAFCPNFWATFQATSGEAEHFEETAAAPDWYDHLYRRILETDERAPVVFVASSGGGSRAALFTALVLEALANEPLTDSSGQSAYDGSWDGQIVLMSSVSGGSLGNGYYAQRLTQSRPEIHRPAIRNSFAQALAGQTDREYGTVFQTYYQPLWRDYADEAERSADGDTKQWAKAIGPAITLQVTPTTDANFSRRFLQSAFADDMCTDFMAPLGRALMTPELERGRGLAIFWDQRFAWGGINNRRRFPYGGEQQRRSPLLLFNATEVGSGRRLVIGFPPLYANTFRPPAPAHPLTASKLEQTVALEDFSPAFELRLSEAIRLSANFPWGIPPATLKRTAYSLKPNLDATTLKKVRERLTAADAPVLKALYPIEAGQAALLRDDVSLEKQQEDLDSLLDWLAQYRFDARVPLDQRKQADGVVTRLENEKLLNAAAERELALDGGVNDNTGIPTICELLEHLQRVARPYDRVLFGTADVPVEVMTATRAEKAWLILHELKRRGVVLVEIDSGAKPSADSARVLRDLRVPIQGLENAGYDNALGAKDEYLARIQEVVRPSRATGATGDRDKSESIIAESPLLHVPFVCNHSTDEDVMTAWALAPRDKAKIFATFFCELREWQQIKQPWFRQHWLWAWEYRKAHPLPEEEDADRRLAMKHAPDGPPILLDRKRPPLPARAPTGGSGMPSVPVRQSFNDAKRANFQKKER